MPDDAKNLYAAMLAKAHGIGLTIAIVHERITEHLSERAGIDVAINPRTVTAEEIVRWAHDPRIAPGLAMLEGDRFEILDITVREESKLVGKPFKELPMTGSLIGAIVRDGRGDLPARRRHARAGRPRDHLHRVGPRARGRKGAVTLAAGASTSAPRSTSSARSSST